MIKISKLTDYAILVLYEMAKNPNTRLSAGYLAQKSGVPDPTVAKLLKIMAKEDLVKSVRGVNGGYILERAPEEIAVTDVITAIEGPVTITACSDAENEDCCSLSDNCPAKKGWQAVNAAITDTLGQMTLAEILKDNQ
ncbi:MAG: SUF system Fe-S cluster assembly regulator [Rhodospirillales bacterium]|nr:SUF system Fe-S cluster assembly regulator [Rhodospirillales bacterium]